jgi:Putative Flp pilus-assembly TadE/G-like
MRMSHSGRVAALIGDEGGAVLVLFALFAPVAVLIAAFALNTGNWYLQKRQLQVRADAGALAAAQEFLACSDEPVYKAAGQYGGAGSVTPPPPGKAVESPEPRYNVPPGGSSNIHELINSQKYFGQANPVDSTASTSPPCSAQMVDVKLTDTGAPWYWQALAGPNINAHARVEILNETSTAGAEPFAEPLPTPNTMTATLVDESNNDAPVAGPVTLTPSGEHTLWTTASAVPVTFNNSKTGSFPVGLRIAMSGGSTATCGSAGVTCYDNSGASPGIGVTYTRVWSNTGTPGLPLGTPVAPQASDVSLGPVGVTPCANSPGGAFSNFVSSPSDCTVAVSANMKFTSAAGTALTCSTASLTLTAGAGAVSIPCPSGGPNGTWTSAAATVPANGGKRNFTLGWVVTDGNKPVGATGGSGGKCTSAAPCKASFGVVQRVYSGAYDSKTVDADEKTSGPILGAMVTDTSGNEIMSLQRGTTKSVNITVNVLGFQPSTSIPSAPVELSFGGNQANGALACKGDTGNPALEKALAEGCDEAYATTSAPAATACSGSPSPPVCVTENPGNGKLDKDLDKGMNKRINEGKAVCVNPNRWASPNTVGQILTKSPPDPRLIITIITDSGAFTNGSAKIPVRGFATFYVTGWAGDPCINQPNGISNGLAYTKDDDPGSQNTGVLLGHFVKFIDTLNTKETGSGKCEVNLINRCIAVLTR